MIEPARQFLKVLYRIESFVAALAYVLVAGLLIGDVLGREFTGQGIFGASKMAVYAAIVAGFLGLGLATAAGAHLRPAFLDAVFPDHLDRQVWRAADIVSTVIYVLLAWIAFKFVLTTRESGDRAAVLYWTLWPLQCVIPYAFVSCAVRHAIFSWHPALRPATEV